MYLYNFELFFATVDGFPIGVVFSHFDSFGNYLYICKAFAEECAAVRVDPLGKVTNLAKMIETFGIAFP
jgi:hypothetical protein